MGYKFLSSIFIFNISICSNIGNVRFCCHLLYIVLNSLHIVLEIFTVIYKHIVFHESE